MSRTLAPFQRSWWLWLPPLLLVTTLAQWLPLMDPDLWWHLRTGQWILEHGRIPEVNTFSHAQPNHPWLVFEWLSQVCFYLFYKTLGFNGVYLLRFLLVSTAWIIWFYQAARSFKDAGAAILLLLLAFLFMKFRLGERPELFSQCLVAVFSAWLLVKQPSTFAAFVPLIILQAIWTNLHGYFFLGPGLVGWWVLRTTLLENLERPVLLARWFGLAGVVGGSLLNPWGPGIYFFLFAHKQSVVLRHVSEFMPAGPLDFHPSVFGFYTYMLAAIGISAARVLKSVQQAQTGETTITPGREFLGFLLDVALIVAGFYMGLGHIRFMWLLLVLSLPVAMVNYASFDGKPVLKGRLEHVQLIAPLALTAYAVWTVIPPLYYRKLGPDFGIYPEASLAFAKRNQLKGPMFNDYNTGGWLMLYGWPAYQVYIDGRFAYSDRFYGRFFQLMNNPLQWRKEFPRKKFGFGLVETSTERFDAYLRFPLNGAYKIAYTDPKFFVPVRRNQGAALKEIRYICPCKDISYLDRYVKGAHLKEIDAEFDYLLKESRYAIGTLAARWFRLRKQPAKALAILKKTPLDRQTTQSAVYETPLSYVAAKDKAGARNAIETFYKKYPDVIMTSHEWLEALRFAGFIERAMETAREAAQNPFDLEAAGWLSQNSPYAIERRRLVREIKKRKGNVLKFQMYTYQELLKGENPVAAFGQLERAFYDHPKDPLIRKVYLKQKKQLHLIYPEDVTPGLTGK